MDTEYITNTGVWVKAILYSHGSLFSRDLSQCQLKKVYGSPMSFPFYSGMLGVSSGCSTSDWYSKHVIYDRNATLYFTQPVR